MGTKKNVWLGMTVWLDFVYPVMCTALTLPERLVGTAAGGMPVEGDPILARTADTTLPPGELCGCRSGKRGTD